MEQPRSSSVAVPVGDGGDSEERIGRGRAGGRHPYSTFRSLPEALMVGGNAFPYGIGGSER